MPTLQVQSAACADSRYILSPWRELYNLILSLRHEAKCVILDGWKKENSRKGHFGGQLENLLGYDNGIFFMEVGIEFRSS